MGRPLPYEIGHMRSKKMLIRVRDLTQREVPALSADFDNAPRGHLERAGGGSLFVHMTTIPCGPGTCRRDFFHPVHACGGGRRLAPPFCSVTMEIAGAPIRMRGHRWMERWPRTTFVQLRI